MAPLASRLVDVEVADTERAAAVLASLPIVASTTQLGDTLHVILARGSPPAEQCAPRLATALGTAGIAGARTAPARATLEDVFVALMLGEDLERGDGPHGGRA
jgi:hypothetical protein